MPETSIRSRDHPDNHWTLEVTNSRFAKDGALSVNIVSIGKSVWIDKSMVVQLAEFLVDHWDEIN